MSNETKIERLSYEKIVDRLAELSMSKVDFIAEVKKRAPAHMKPHATYLYAILGGKQDRITTDYLTIFADVLQCKRDDLFA